MSRPTVLAVVMPLATALMAVPDPQAVPSLASGEAFSLLVAGLVFLAWALGAWLSLREEDATSLTVSPPQDRQIA
ncbi:hypothetical protein [Nitrospira sp. Kam-Ns4a]